MPKPFLEFSLQSVPLVGIAVPLSGSLAPLRLVTNVQTSCLSSLITAGFLDSHAFTRLPDSPDDYELPFHAPPLPLARFPVVLDSSHRT